MKFIFLHLLFLLFFTSCSTKSHLQKTSFDKIDGFYEDNLTLAFEVFKKNCKKSIKLEYLKEICQEENLKNQNAYEFFTKNFTPHILIDNQGRNEGTITGYYEPILDGRLVKDEVYKYPIYQMPNFEIYTPRSEIEKRDDLKAIAFVKNEADLYLLHLQGSGKIKLEDGEIINIAFAGTNNQKYSSIGKYMIEMGYLKSHEATIKGMKKYLDENPSKVNEILNQNDRYIFFKISDKNAVGSLGVELVEQRSIAVDTSYINLGLPVFINTKNPISKEEIKQLVIANDRGADIKGKIRADYYWGKWRKGF